MSAVIVMHGDKSTKKNPNRKAIRMFFRSFLKVISLLSRHDVVDGYDVGNVGGAVLVHIAVE